MAAARYSSCSFHPGSTGPSDTRLELGHILPWACDRKPTHLAPMRIATLYLALALALLWFPTAFFLGRRRRRELRNPTRSDLITLPSLLCSPFSWIDLFRAAGGTLILTHLAVIPPNRALTPVESAIGLAIFALPLVISSWVQTMVTGSRWLRLAPLFFLLGIAATALPWEVVLFGSLLGLTLTGMLGRWRFVFWILPACLIAASVLFRQIGIPSLLVPILFGIPALLDLNPNRPLAWVSARPDAWGIGKTEKNKRRRRRSGSRAGGNPAGTILPAAKSVGQQKG